MEWRATYVEDDAALPLEVVEDVIKDGELDHILVSRALAQHLSDAVRG